MTQHDALLVDLDGTVYAGPHAIPGAVEALEAARARGQTVSYVTNNASRAPGAVSEHLTSLGLTLTAAGIALPRPAGQSGKFGHSGVPPPLLDSQTVDAPDPSTPERLLVRLPAQEGRKPPQSPPNFSDRACGDPQACAARGQDGARRRVSWQQARALPP